MVKVFTPAYGTALEYGAGVPKGPLDLSVQFNQQLLRAQTMAFLSMGIDSGRSIEAVATHTFGHSRNLVPPAQVVPFNHTAVDIARHAIDTYGRKHGIRVFGAMRVMGKDCYTQVPSVSLQEAVDYHLEQASALRDGGVDALLAETVSNLLEGRAFVRVASMLELPLYLSIVPGDDGNLLDGTPIGQFIAAADAEVPALAVGSTSTNGFQPVKYLANCAFPEQIALMYQRARSAGQVHRLGGFYANASALPHQTKEQNGGMHRNISAEQYQTWVVGMLEEYHDTKDPEVWVSGCCGFGARDIDLLLNHLPNELFQSE